MKTCGQARDCLTCRHCGLNIGRICNLMTHLKTHGVKRFVCGFESSVGEPCEYDAHTKATVLKHLENKHNVFKTNEVDIGLVPGAEKEEDVFLCYYPSY